MQVQFDTQVDKTSGRWVGWKTITVTDVAVKPGSYKGRKEVSIGGIAIGWMVHEDTWDSEKAKTVDLGWSGWLSASLTGYDGYKGKYITDNKKMADTLESLVEEVYNYHQSKVGALHFEESFSEPSWCIQMRTRYPEDSK